MGDQLVGWEPCTSTQLAGCGSLPLSRLYVLICAYLALAKHMVRTASGNTRRATNTAHA